MDKKEVTQFFDAAALTWDDNPQPDKQRINFILDNAFLRPGCKVLDVACGTGILIPYYLERKAGFVTAVDISANMIKKAKEKFSYTGVEFICGDIEECSFDCKFDSIMVFNALPHFPDEGRLISKLESMLEVGGCVSIAHSMGRKKLSELHSKCAGHVSNELLPLDKIKALFSEKMICVTETESDEVFQVTLRKEG